MIHGIPDGLPHILDIVTAMAWQDLCTRVTCEGPMPVDLTVEWADDEKNLPTRVVVKMYVPPVDGQRLDDDQTYAVIGWYSLRSLGPPSLTTLYKIAREFWLHELMERFQVDGKVHVEPHPKAPARRHTLDKPDGVFP